jgi:hypothetical protein
MKSHRVNSTFVFFADTKANTKKPKELFFANARNKAKFDKLITQPKSE